MSTSTQLYAQRTSVFPESWGKKLSIDIKVFQIGPFLTSKEQKIQLSNFIRKLISTPGHGGLTYTA